MLAGVVFRCRYCGHAPGAYGNANVGNGASIETVTPSSSVTFHSSSSSNRTCGARALVRVGSVARLGWGRSRRSTAISFHATHTHIHTRHTCHRFPPFLLPLLSFSPSLPYPPYPPYPPFTLPYPPYTHENTRLTNSISRSTVSSCVMSNGFFANAFISFTKSARSPCGTLSL